MTGDGEVYYMITIIYWKGGSVVARGAVVRTEIVSSKFTPDERSVLEDQARKEQMSVSDYVRAAVMFSLIMDGNLRAVKITSGLVRAKVAEWLSSKPSLMDRMLRAVRKV